MCICIFRGWEGVYTYVCIWRSEVNIGYLLQSLWTRVADQKVLMSSSLHFLSSGILGLNHYSCFLSPGCQGIPTQVLIVMQQIHLLVYLADFMQASYMF